MLQLIQVTSDEQNSLVRQLFSEYVQLLQEKANQEYGISIDVDAILHMFMMGINDFILHKEEYILPNMMAKSQALVV